MIAMFSFHYHLVDLARTRHDNFYGLLRVVQQVDLFFALGSTL
jgi:hypothetical protein